ncbi:MAG: outer membrane lipoprotein-sorting protein [Spirochaetota bacterium]
MNNYSQKLFLSALLIAVGTLVALPAAAAPDETAEQVIRKLEENQVHETARSEGKMIINDRFGEKVTTFKSWAEGEEKTLIEFTSRQERGQKILRTNDEIYLYFPDAAEVIRLQGAALRDSVLGSDMSYEDMTGGKGILDDYHAELLGTENVDERQCYKIELTAKGRGVAYPKENIWIDTEMYVTRKVHMFSLSGKLLKEMRIQDYTTQSGKTFPVRFVIEDKMKRNSSTEFVIESIEIGADIPASRFSLEELTW